MPEASMNGTSVENTSGGQQGHCKERENPAAARPNDSDKSLKEPIAP